MERMVIDGLTFDDVLMLPQFSTVLPHEADLSTRLVRDVHLSIPIVSAAMDTVTGHQLAIAIAKEGGMGFIHKNMTIEEQAAEVTKVKRYEAGVVLNPTTVTPDTTVAEINELKDNYGFSTYPVVQGSGSKLLVGLITKLDLKWQKDGTARVRDFMVPFEKLVTVTRHPGSTPQSQSTTAHYISPSLPFTPSEIRNLMEKHQKEKILVIDEDQNLAGLICHQDFEKLDAQPHACRDAEGRLRVGAAIGCDSNALERLAALIDAKVDVILVDSSHGHSQGILDTVRRIREMYETLPLIAGNVCTYEGAAALAEAGADCIKCGVGPGSICTTRVITGVGCPQFTAIVECARACRERDIPLIADGGIRFSGDIAKAIGAGAACVMVGSLFAGTEESPGTTELIEGRVYKTYRGMGSLGAMSAGSADRYFQDAKQKLVPEGVEGVVPYKGHLKGIIYQQMGGLRSGMGLTGCRTIPELQTKARFCRITGNAVSENHPHNILMTKEPPNYSPAKAHKTFQYTH